jgi:transposase-like protein
MKRARKVRVVYRELTQLISEYKCPFCKVYFVGAGINKNILRFKCEKCGNELIVDENQPVPEKSRDTIENCTITCP